MHQEFQKYFFQNPRKWGKESASQAAQPVQPVQAKLAVLSSWQILCPIFQDFEKNIFGILEVYPFTLRRSNIWDLKLQQILPWGTVMQMGKSENMQLSNQTLVTAIYIKSDSHENGAGQENKWAHHSPFAEDKK